MQIVTPEVLNTLINSVVVALGLILIYAAKRGIAYMDGKTSNERFHALNAALDAIVTDVVKDLQQTAVAQFKFDNQGKLDPVKIADLKQMAKSKVQAALQAMADKTLLAGAGALDDVIQTKVEAHLDDRKRVSTQALS